MGEASTTILEDMIRQALKEDGVSIPDSQQVPADFDFQKVSIDFKLKVFKMMLEEIIRKLEKHDDYQTFPEESLSAVKRGLNDTSNGFYALLESRTPKISKDVKTKIDEVHPFLLEAQAFTYAATTELEENGKKYDYFLALLKCRDKMFQIKLLLRMWEIKKDNT